MTKLQSCFILLPYLHLLQLTILEHQFTVIHADCTGPHRLKDDCTDEGEMATFTCPMEDSTTIFFWRYSQPDSDRFNDIASPNISYEESHYTARIVRGDDGSVFSRLTVKKVAAERNNGLIKCEADDPLCGPVKILVGSQLPSELDKKPNGSVQLDGYTVTGSAWGFKATPGITLRLVINGNEVQTESPRSPVTCQKTTASLLYNLTEDEYKEQSLNLELKYLHPTFSEYLQIDKVTIVPDGAQDESDENGINPLIIGGIAAGIFLLIVIVCCVLCRKCRSNKKSDTADVSLPPTRKVLLGDKPPDKPTAAIKLDNLNNSGSDSANLLSTKDATTRDSHGSGYSGRDIENKLRQSDQYRASDGEESFKDSTSSRDRSGYDNTYATIPGDRGVTNYNDTIDSDDEENGTLESRGDSRGSRDLSRENSTDSWVQVDARRKNYAAHGDGQTIQGDVV